MSLKLFAVTTWDMNGEDWNYTVCAEDPTDAAVMAMESRLENEMEGDLEDFREGSVGDIEILAIATMRSFDKVGVVDLDEIAHMETKTSVPAEKIIRMVEERRDLETPAP